MNTITIALPDDCLPKLKEKANHFNISPEELVRVSIEELLTRPDETFQAAVDYVLKKNAELQNALLRVELKQLSRDEEAHLEKEFEGYDQLYPPE